MKEDYFRLGDKKIARIKTAGLPSPEVSPARGLIDHFPFSRVTLQAKCEVCKLPKGGVGWPEDAAGF